MKLSAYLARNVYATVTGQCRKCGAKGQAIRSHYIPLAPYAYYCPECRSTSFRIDLVVSYDTEGHLEVIYKRSV